MRLSEWRATSPVRSSVEPKVVSILEAVLASLGTGRDPHCWVVWGEDVATRWQVLVPTMPGLVVAFVRVNIPGEGPRTTAKLVRWTRVQVGELAMETQAGHRLLSFSVEGQILKGADAAADGVATFALGLLSAIDGRMTDVEKTFATRPTSRGRGAGARGVGARGAGAKSSGGSARSGSKPRTTAPTSRTSPAKAAATGAVTPPGASARAAQSRSA